MIHDLVPQLGHRYKFTKYYKEYCATLLGNKTANVNDILIRDESDNSLATTSSFLSDLTDNISEIEEKSNNTLTENIHFPNRENAVLLSSKHEIDVASTFLVSSCSKQQLQFII